MIPLRSILAAALAIACLRAAEPVSTVRTNDGLTLGLGQDGQLRSLEVDARPVPLTAAPVLFHLRDAARNSRFEPVTGNATGADGRLVVNRARAPHGLTFVATIASRGDYLQIDGEVGTAEPGDRCVDLRISLPVGGDGIVAGRGLFDGPAPARKSARKKSAPAATPDGDLDAAGGEDNALYPLIAISHAATGTGLALAVPPTHPTRFVMDADRSGAHLVLRIGISPSAATPGRTPFRAIVYRHDAAWGFRAALARYYAFYRDDFFTRRARRIGAWTTQNPSKLANPHLYAYHEAGFATWRHPDGTDSGVNVKLTLEHLDEGPVAHTLADYERLCELALDEKHGIYSLPYTIVGQRQLLQLPALPRDYDEAMRTLADWKPREVIRFDGPPQAVSFRSADELKAIIRNSTLHDAGHRLAFMARPYRGPTLTFPQNPNPNLFRGEEKPTIARYTLDYYIPMMLESDYVDGIYMDSLGRWCGFHNFRTEHFRYSTVPLTYAGTPPQVSIWSLQSHAEYMWEARRRLHARGKILMANGVHPERVMLGFACDVMGREGAPALGLGEPFYALRVAAGVKPYCLLNAHHRTSPQLWNACLYMGYLMGCNDPKGLADEAKYLPLIIACNEAGWEPVTHARAAPAAVGVERWGGGRPDAPLYFTVMNRSAEPVNAMLTIDRAALDRRDDMTVRTRPENIAIHPEQTATQLVLRFPLGPEKATMIEVSGR